MSSAHTYTEAYSFVYGSECEISFWYYSHKISIIIASCARAFRLVSVRAVQMGYFSFLRVNNIRESSFRFVGPPLLPRSLYKRDDCTYSLFASVFCIPAVASFMRHSCPSGRFIASRASRSSAFILKMKSHWMHWLSQGSGAYLRTAALLKRLSWNFGAFFSQTISRIKICREFVIVNRNIRNTATNAENTALWKFPSDLLWLSSLETPPSLKLVRDNESHGTPVRVCENGKRTSFSIHLLHIDGQLSSEHRTGPFDSHRCGGAIVFLPLAANGAWNINL